MNNSSPKNKSFIDVCECLLHYLPSKTQEPNKTLHRATIDTFDRLHFISYALKKHIDRILSLFSTPDPTIDTANEIIEEAIELSTYLTKLQIILYTLHALSPFVTIHNNTSKQKTP